MVNVNIQVFLPLIHEAPPVHLCHNGTVQISPLFYVLFLHKLTRYVRYIYSLYVHDLLGNFVTCFVLVFSDKEKLTV